MPTLEWIGKDKVINHHQQVPFRILERQYSFDQQGQSEVDNNSENMIIHGDNLEALKSLLPYYEGKVKCIYIDPPYNTGNEGWVYNDNVNSPKMKKWLGEAVGKEGEDLSRHDKWLCMMYPRLKLLGKLLADDGVIFISIDDNEQANLRLICDEIFGSSNFIAQFTWKRRASSAMSQRSISIDHEYILTYGKSNDYVFLGTEKDFKGYSNPDNDPRGDWTTGDLTVGMNSEMRPNQFYDLVDPDTGNIFKPNPNRVWSYIPESMEKLIFEKRIVFPSSVDKRPMKKRFASELKTDTNPISTWLTDVGINTEGTRGIQKIFGDAVFSYPKPKSLIEILIKQVTGNNDIILDSFAGSGTTAHAVLNLNKSDGGNRKFILVEMESYAETVTAERVRRVINGFADERGIDSDFSYFRLGEILLLPDGNINENVDERKIREYVYYMDTKERLLTYENTDNKYYLGKNKETVYYFFYEKNKVTTLDHEFLSAIREKADGYIVYADLCTLSERELKRYNIVFKKIPRDIAKL
ncbi:site-specific DNA-methyltransferase [Fusibacter bizertensis]